MTLGRMERAVAAAGKRVPFVHAVARRVRDVVRGASYRRLCSKTPVEPNVVVFESYSGRSYSCSPRALYRAMRSNPRWSGGEFIWAMRADLAGALSQHGCDVRGLGEGRGEDSAVDLGFVLGDEALAELQGARVVVWGSREYYESYARAGHWVTNCRIPSHLLPRGSQVLVQTWHGTPLKRLGFDMLPGVSRNAMYSLRDWREHYGLEGRRLTYLLAQSEFAATVLTSAFNLTTLGKRDAVIEEGYPRNDALAHVTALQVERLRRRFGIPEGKRVALYAPTWRDDQHSSRVGYTFRVAVDFARLERELGGEWVVLFRPHYLIAEGFDFSGLGGFVIDVSKVSDINDLYAASDVLVTDYSSVVFDYCDLGRPMVFHLYDLEEYENEIRGFYLDIEDLPGPVTRTDAELIAALRQVVETDHEGDCRLALFVDKFAPKDDGASSERVLGRIMSGTRDAAQSGSACG